jgi:hypothetical protein
MSIRVFVPVMQLERADRDEGGVFGEAFLLIVEDGDEFLEFLGAWRDS